MARAGLNAHMTYSVGGTQYQFDVRVEQLFHGSRMVADESMSRTRRAYYPHRLSASQFSMMVILKGYSERTLFSNFLNDYINRALDPSQTSGYAQMAVVMPVRNFLRRGVPLNGIQWGTSTGAMIWKPVVTFETTYDASIGDGQNTPQSQFVLDNRATDQAPELKYFYPAGIQLSGDQVPPSGDFTKQVSQADIQDIISGGTSGGSDAGFDPNYWGGVPYLPGHGPTPGSQIFTQGR